MSGAAEVVPLRLSHAARLCELFAGDRSNIGAPKAELVDRKLRFDAESGEYKKHNRQTPPPTPELWQRHLDGELTLGVYPRAGDGTCRWGALDVDDYSLDHADLVARIERENLPLVVCRTKSGGARVIVFCKQPVAWDQMRQLLTGLAARLDLGKPGEGDLDRIQPGNLWMPHGGGDSSPCPGVRARGLETSVSSFLLDCERVRLATDEFEVLLSETAARRKADMRQDDPAPVTRVEGATYAKAALARFCAGLRAWASGGRNTYLNNAAFQMGRMVGAGWIDREQVAAALTDAALAAGLPQAEIDNGRGGGTLPRGLDDGQHADPPEIGANYPVFEHVAIVLDDPPTWTIQLPGGVVTMPAGEVFDQRKFGLRCMEAMVGVFAPMKPQTWAAMVGRAMVGADVREPDAGTTVADEFHEMLTDFLTDRNVANSRDEIPAGKPWPNEEKQRYEFRIADLVRHMERDGSARTKNMSRRDASARVQAIPGAGKFPGKTTILGKTTNLWWVPFRAVEGLSEVPLPPSRKDPV